MNKNILSCNQKSLKKIIGKKIIKVERQIFKDDDDLDDYEQNADGYIQFTFDDNFIIYFFPLTELESIGVKEIEMPKLGDSYQWINPSCNEFWSNKTNVVITAIDVIISRFRTCSQPMEHALTFHLKNSQQFSIEFMSDDNCLDTLRVVGKITTEESIVLMNIF
ncbi:MAG: hypothetical protein HQK50_14085 [Oligoflexia bacterium]|nr:hypothetical protein [Oligoflexia bacterium]